MSVTNAATLFACAQNVSQPNFRHPSKAPTLPTPPPLSASIHVKMLSNYYKPVADSRVSWGSLCSKCSYRVIWICIFEKERGRRLCSAIEIGREQYLNYIVSKVLPLVKIRPLHFELWTSDAIVSSGRTISGARVRGNIVKVVRHKWPCSSDDLLESSCVCQKFRLFMLSAFNRRSSLRLIWRTSRPVCKSYLKIYYAICICNFKWMPVFELLNNV